VCLARKELVDVGLTRLVAGTKVLATEPVRKKRSIGATAQEAIPVLNYAMASPRVFLMGAPIKDADDIALIGGTEKFPRADGVLKNSIGTRVIAFGATERVPP
jgi:hypothetical protein